MSEVIKFRKFHDGQKAIFSNMPKMAVIRAGRRFGKTTGLEEIAAHRAVKGLKVGWFAPSYKLIIPTYKRILSTIKPLALTASRNDGLIALQTGGEVEFWTLDDEDAGRSRSYDLVIIDEASLKAKGLRDIWEQAIRPTLLDRGGRAVMAGTPKGIDEENFFYTACNDKSLGWKEYHAPSWKNPTLNAEAVANLQRDNSPLVWQQEYCAEFVDWSGSAFFSIESITADGAGITPPQMPVSVFATIDTAVKTGSKNDGTAVIYWALYPPASSIRLVALDYDKVQIEGSLLETWLPTIYQNLEDLAKTLNPVYGSIGAFIEDKASGTILLQQAARRGWAAHPIQSKLTSVGKDERAISVSGYIYKGLVKLSVNAMRKVIQFKGVTRNHLITEVCGFRIGIDNGADDLTDCFTYGVSIGIGNNDGF
ncbi:MAG: hypothetical protein ABL856_09115 [Gallionella sp.]